MAAFLFAPPEGAGAAHPSGPGGYSQTGPSKLTRSTIRAVDFDVALPLRKLLSAAF
jgi:hypothetical protein